MSRRDRQRLEVISAAVDAIVRLVDNVGYGSILPAMNGDCVSVRPRRASSTAPSNDASAPNLEFTISGGKASAVWSRARNGSRRRSVARLIPPPTTTRCGSSSSTQVRICRASSSTPARTEAAASESRRARSRMARAVPSVPPRGQKRPPWSRAAPGREWHGRCHRCRSGARRAPPGHARPSAPPGEHPSRSSRCRLSRR